VGCVSTASQEQARPARSPEPARLEVGGLPSARAQPATAPRSAAIVADPNDAGSEPLPSPEPGKLSRAELDAIWNDPGFQKQFVAGYGILSEVEPRVTPEEIELLEEVRPLMAGDLSKAERVLEAGMELDCSAILDFTLGGIQYQQDDFDAARESYRRAVTKFPSFRRAWRHLGLILVRDADYDAAIEAFTRMIELGGGDAYSFGLLGFAHSSKQDYQPAEAAYRNALLMQPDNTEWRLGLTRCVFRQGKYQDAAALLDVLIERYPDKADFWLLQAQTFQSMGRPLRAAENFEAVDRLGRAPAESLHALGDIYVSEGLLELAGSAYERAIDADAGQPLARPLRAAELLTARGALAEARQVATHIRGTWDQRMEETDRRKLLKIEARISMAEGVDSAETAGVLLEIVELDPLDGDALILLGQHYSRQNDPDRAIFYYERAASLDAFEVNAKIRHAQVLVGMSRYAEAVPLLRRAQEVKPREDIARYLEQVERLAKSRR
jgi:tetratricopeptide (TPR) repeat protein